VNWAALRQLTGWLPGAAGGSILGLFTSFFCWSSEARPCASCSGSARSPSNLNCVKTIAGDFTTLLDFAAAVMAAAGIVGAGINFFQAHSVRRRNRNSPSRAEEPYASP
jgi:hypothetical protein